MIKKFIFIVLIVVFGCSKETQLGKEFQCKSSKLDNLEEVKDLRNRFSVTLPKTWKTNLYEDALQSSIFSADTTKQLTETFLIDVSFIKNELQFNDLFKLKLEQENLKNKLIQTKSRQLNILEKPSYLVISKGKKSSFIYQQLQAYIKIDTKFFILAKAEVYGDALIEERLCKAISLIERIKINQ